MELKHGQEPWYCIRIGLLIVPYGIETPKAERKGEN